MIGQLHAYFEAHPELSADQRKAISLATSAVLGATLDGGQGAAIATNATQYNYLNHVQAAAYVNELKRCGDNPDCREKVIAMARDIHRQNDEAMMRACMAPSSSACISHMQALLDGQSVLNANGAVLGSSAPDFNAQTLLNSTKISGLINDWKQGIPPRFDGRLVDKRSGIELNPVVHNGETYYLQPLTAEEVCGLSRDCHADLKAGLSFTKLGLEAITGKDGNVYYRGFTDKQVADQVAKGFGVASIAFGGAGQKAYSFTASVVGAGVSIVTADNKLVEIPAQIVGFAAGQIVPKVVSESIELGPIGSAALSGVSGDAVSSGVRDSLTVEK